MRATILSLFLFAIMMACAEPERRSGSAARTWKAIQLLGVGEDVGVGGVCVGDFDISTKGLEVGALVGDGRVFIIRKEEAAWRSQLTYEGLGELIQGRAVARGDGPDAIVAVGMVDGPESDTEGPGCVVLLVPNEGEETHRATRLWTSDRCGHGVAVADLLSDIPGLEVAAADFGGRVAICRGPGKDATVVYSGSDRAKALVAAELSPGGEGLELVCAYASGEVVIILRQKGGYVGRLLIRRDAGASRLAAGDIDPKTSGPEIVCGFDDGAVVEIRRSGDGWTGREILRAPKKIRGVVIGEIDPASPGLEVAAAAKDGTVRIVQEGNPEGRIIFRGTHPLHDLAAADLLPDFPGDELVTGGYGGNVTLIFHGGGE